jgi:uncharacterized protein (TIGR02466 family)
MIINDVFTSIVAQDYLELDNQELEKFCKDHIYKSMVYENDKDTQSDYLDLTRSELLPLVKLVESKVTELHNCLGLNPLYKHRVIRAWANLNDSNAVKVPHVHPNNGFTCVYYVKGNDTSGDLQLMSPIAAKEYVIQPYHIREYNKFTSSGYRYSPEPGKLIIFNPWLYHWVHPNTGTTERISIAFDTEFTEIK